jgi:hypothetical protein
MQLCVIPTISLNYQAERQHLPVHVFLTDVIVVGCLSWIANFWCFAMRALVGTMCWKIRIYVLAACHFEIGRQTPHLHIIAIAVAVDVVVLLRGLTSTEYREGRWEAGTESS